MSPFGTGHSFANWHPLADLIPRFASLGLAPSDNNYMMIVAMRRHRKLSLLAKMTLGASLLFVLFWITTLYHGWGYQGASLRVMVKCGYINIYRGTNRLPATWYHERLEPTLLSKFYSPRFSVAGRSFTFTLPLLYPFLLIAVFTAIAWRRSRPVDNSCHSCGYDLTGNVSGNCPECGQSIIP